MAVLKNEEKQVATLELKSGQSFLVKDHRGFTVFQITETGDVKHKGKMVKL